MAEGRVLPNERRTKCEVWTRVMGYHRPVEYWNKGKQAEHAERKHFVEPQDYGMMNVRVA